MSEISLEAVNKAKQVYESEGYVPLTCSKSLDEELAEVRALLQDAVVLEHATIPTYLTMLYTLDQDVPWRITEVIRSVVVEEMLHFVLAANVLNAIGGRPNIYSADFIPNYPSYLPHKVDGIKVHLLGFSKEAVGQGLIIEHPKDVRPEAVLKGVHADMTIGEYYALIEGRLRAMVRRFGDCAVFCGDPARQIPPHMYYYDGGGSVVEVHNLDTACEALKLITDQGEGARNSIWTGRESASEAGYREVAHYFRFDELAKERLYKIGDTVESGPTGPPLSVPWHKAVKICGDAKLADYPAGEVRQAIHAFNTLYSELLCMLQAAFDGKPEVLIDGVVEMYKLRDAFRAITANPFPGRVGVNCAPTFEFVPSLTYPAADLGHDKGSDTSGKPTSNKQALDMLNAAYASGSVAAAVAVMSEDVIWDISGPVDVPYTGVFYGHTGFKKFWNLLGNTVNFGISGIEQTFFSGNQAIAYGGEQGTTKAKNSPYHYDWAIKYRFNEDHLITAMRQYYDPRRIQAALNGPAYPPNPSSQSSSGGSSDTASPPLPAPPPLPILPLTYH